MKRFVIGPSKTNSRSGDTERRYREFRDSGMRLLEEGSAEEAIKALGRAIYVCPYLAEAHLNIGRALHMAGKIEAARNAYQRAAREDPQCIEAQSALKRLPSPPPSRRDFDVGQVVGSSTTKTMYRIDGVLRGGFGAVYIATDVDSGGRYALKTFQSKYLWSDEDRDRFEREALTWIMLGKHPNIVSAEVIIHIEGLPCLELEYVAGGDLEMLLEQGPLTPAHALKLAFNFCDGMSYAHETLGLVHRDVKPGNCLLDETGNLKITDFGLARSFVRAEEQRLELSGFDADWTAQYTTAQGSRRYMAPEQHRPGAILDTRTDIYSFGITLYQMLTGDLPSSGSVAYSNIATNGPDYALPGGLLEVILRCVEPEPRRRPASFGELRGVLSPIYKALSGADPPNPAIPSPMKKADWKNRGIALGAFGRYEEEIECYDRALKIDSGDSELWQNKGVALRLLGRTQQAIECYNRGLQILPNDKGLWMNKGAALGSLGRHEAEIKCYEHALTFAPHDSQLWKNKGVALGEQKRYEEEIQCYDRALENEPRDSELWQNKGVALRLLGRTDESIECYERGLEVAPRDSHLWQNKGVALASKGRYEAAIECFDRALEIAPRDHDLWMNKGVAHGEMRCYEKEIECYERGLELAPRHRDLWMNKSLALRQLHRDREAAACLQKAREFS